MYMKTLYYLSIIFALLVCSSCSSDDEDKNSISLNATGITIPHNGDSFQVIVKCTTDFSIKISNDEDWIICTSTNQVLQGQTEAIVSFLVYENEEWEARSTEIIFTNTLGKQAVFKVTQDSGLITIDNKAGTLSAAAIDDYRYAKITGVLNSQDFEVIYNSHVSYLDISDTKIVGNDGNAVDTIPASQKYNTNLNSIVLPNCITRIGYRNFENLYIDSLVIPDNVKTIERYAFGWSHFKKIELPKNLKEIPNYAFAYSKNLKCIVLPETLVSIGDYAFEECALLEDIQITKNVSKIGVGAFAWCRKLKEINIPDMVSRIENATFYYCSSLENISLSNNITSIGFNAFCSCGKLKDIKFPSKLETIEEQAFEWCAKLEDLYFPEGMKSIGINAFSGCVSLNNISIPSTVTGIGYRCFSNNSNLSTFNPKRSMYLYTSTMPNTILSEEDQGYSLYWYMWVTNNIKTTLFVPKGCLDVYKAQPTIEKYFIEICEMQ